VELRAPAVAKTVVDRPADENIGGTCRLKASVTLSPRRWVAGHPILKIVNWQEWSESHSWVEMINFPYNKIVEDQASIEKILESTTNEAGVRTQTSPINLLGLFKIMQKDYR